MKIDEESDYYIYYVARYNIRKYRYIKGFIAQELADRSGYTHQFIRNLESLRMIMRPRLDSLYNISKALDIDIRLLFDDSDLKGKKTV